MVQRAFAIQKQEGESREKTWDDKSHAQNLKWKKLSDISGKPAVEIVREAL